jgi:hypothetical protein
MSTPFRGEVARAGVHHLRNVEVGAGNAPVNAVVFLPEPALELQTHLAGVVVRHQVHGPLHVGRKVVGNAAQHRQGNGADAEVAGQFFGGAGLFVEVRHGGPGFRLLISFTSAPYVIFFPIFLTKPS